MPTLAENPAQIATMKWRFPGSAGLVAVETALSAEAVSLQHGLKKYLIAFPLIGSLEG